MACLLSFWECSFSVQSNLRSKADYALQKMYDTFADFIAAWVQDMLPTFPELEPQLKAVLAMDMSAVASHVRTAAEKFANGLNGDIEALLSKEAGAPVDFLPGIDFHKVWALGPSQATKQALLRYINIAVVYALLGDALFQHKRVMESLSSENLEGLFAGLGGGEDDGPGGLGGLMQGLFKNFMTDSLPEELLSGKIGQLAQDILERLTPDVLGIDLKGELSFDAIRGLLARKEEVIKTLMDVVQRVIQEKMASGELTAAELQSEVMRMKGTLMKIMPQLASQLAGMGGGGLGGGPLGGHDARAASDPRRQRILERLRKKRAGGAAPPHNPPGGAASPR